MGISTIYAQETKLFFSSSYHGIKFNLQNIKTPWEGQGPLRLSSLDSSNYNMTPSINTGQDKVPVAVMDG